MERKKGEKKKQQRDAHKQGSTSGQLKTAPTRKKREQGGCNGNEYQHSANTSVYAKDQAKRTT